jgi:hypothetical protein
MQYFGVIVLVYNSFFFINYLLALKGGPTFLGFFFYFQITNYVDEKKTVSNSMSAD